MILCTDTILPAGRKCRHAPGDFAEGKIHVPLSGSSDEDHLAVRQISSEAASAGIRRTYPLAGRDLVTVPSPRTAFGRLSESRFSRRRRSWDWHFFPFNIKTNSIKKSALNGAKISPRTSGNPRYKISRKFCHGIFLFFQEHRYLNQQCG